MDEDFDETLVRVRTDTAAFARDLETMRASLEGTLGDGAERAGRALETALTRAIRTGKFGFEDLKRVALSALSDIASAAIRTGLGSLQGGGGGLLGAGVGLLGGLLGLPGRATGGPVSPGRAYVVGERGPELFVPTGSGSIAASTKARSRDVRISIAVNAPAGAAPDMLARSSRQVARAVRAALSED